MRKRITSLFLVLALCLSLLPTTAFAEDTSSVAREARDGTGVGDVYTIGEDTALQDEDGSDEAVQAAQALIDALPEEAADNAEELSAQLIAIDKALAPLTDEQLSALDMTRYEALCAVLAALTAEQADGHTDHALCTHGASCTICPEDAKNSDAFTDAKALTSRVATENNKTYNQLYYDGTAATSNYNLGFEYFILPTGNYYLAEDVKLSYAIQIPANAKVNLCLNGHSITKTTSDTSNFEGVITIENGGTLSLCDCNSSGASNGKITHGTDPNGTKYIGRGVRCGNSGGATFIMYSGEISGNHAGIIEKSNGQDGAGVEMQGGRFTMYGGKITNNHVDVAQNFGGGGVCLHSGANFTMYDGEISSNTSAEDGGGVFAIGSNSFVMQGGTISDNKATERGGGLALYNDTFELSGGIIRDNTAANGGGVYGSDIFLTISGLTEIKDNMAAYGGGVYVNSGTVNMSGGEITGNSVGENGTGGGVYVGSYVDSYDNIPGTLILSGNAVIRGNSVGDRGMGGGVYVSGMTYVGSTSTKTAISTVTMSGSAKITGNSVGGNGAGGGVYVYEYGTFNMNGGEISNNNAATLGNGGGVCLNLGTFNMTDGEITENTAYNGGGGVDAAAGNFTMTGGSITGNSASSGLGGGIHARIPLNMSGKPVIQGNTVGGKSNNVQLTENNVITLTRALEDGAEIYVTPASEPTEDEPVTIAEGKYGNYNAESSNTDKFHKDDADAAYEITYIGGDYYSSKIVMRIKPHTHKVCVGTDCADSSHDEVTWKGVSSLTAGMAADNYYLTTDVTLDTTWTPADGTVLDLNGHSITMQQEGPVIDVTGSFTLTDCKGGKADYGKITHAANVNGRGVDVGNTEKTATSFTMYGGSIYKNTASGDGGGVHVDQNGTFTMYDGEISGNNVLNPNYIHHGGGVSVDTGTFTMSGGTITNNKAPHGGGGVYVYNSSFVMSGNAAITNNKTDTTNNGWGGGVYLYKATNATSAFTMSGNAKIAENSAKTGGGVYMNGGPNFTMNGGNIYGNTASNNGGGVYVTGTFTMTNGNIGDIQLDGNVAKNGGGVYIAGGGTFTMGGNGSSTPSVFANNVLDGNGEGAGVYVDGTFNLTGPVQISDNNYQGSDSNVYLPGDKTIRITGSLEYSSHIGVTLEYPPANEGGHVTFATGSSGHTLDDKDKDNIFFSDQSYGEEYTKYNIVRSGNELWVVRGTLHQHKECAGSGETGCTHSEKNFDVLTYDATNKQLKYNGNVVTSSSGLYAIQSNAGNLYLTDDIRIEGTIQIAADVTLCLNGHSIISLNNADVIQVAAGKTLTLCDCRGSRTDGKYGQITHDTGRTGRGVLMRSDGGTTFTMYGGSISGNTLSENYASGAGVCVPQEATFTMYGGEITGNTLSGSGSTGAGVYAGGNTTITDSAKITGNEITGSNGKGGGIYVSANTLTLCGDAQIKDNKATSGGGIFVSENASNLYISGNVQVTSNGSSNVYLSCDTTYQRIPGISVTGELDTASIGVTVDGSALTDTSKLPLTIATVDSVTTASNWIKNEIFTSDNPLYKVTVSDNGTTAVLNVHDTHTWRVQKKSGEDNVLIERCDCGTYGGTLTVTMEGGAYTGQAYTPTLTYSENWSSEKNHTISYAKKMTGEMYDPVSEAKAWGNYQVTVTLSGNTITQTFTINPAERLRADDFIVTMPTNAVYDENTTWTATATAKGSIASAIGAITVQYFKDGTLVTDDSGKPATAVKDAGTYEVQLVIAAGDGYDADTITGGWTFTVAKAVQQVTVNIGERCSYGSAPSPKMTGLPLGETPIYTYAERGSTNFTATVPTKLGDYTVKATCETANIIYTGEANFSIVPLKVDSDDITLTWTTGADRLTYNGSAQTPDLTKLTVHIALPGYAANQLVKDTDYDITCESKKDKGTYDLTVTLKGNYSGSNTTKWYIDPLTAVLEWQNVTDRVYGDELTVTATVENVCAGDTVTVTVTGGDQTEACTNYTAMATDLSNPNYALPTDVTQTYSIDKASGSVAAPTGETSLRYTGQAQELLQTAATSTTGTVEYKLDGGDWSTELPTATNAGEYTVYYRSTGDNNHNATDGTANITVTIGRKQIEIPQASSTKFFYNGSVQTYDVLGTAEYTASNNTRTDAGSQTVSYELTDKANTEWSDGSNTSKTLTFTIERKGIPITDLDVVLDCGKGFVYDGTAKEPGVKITFQGTTTPLPTDEYTVSYSNNINASNDKIDGVVTVKDSGKGNYTFGEGYYHFNIAPKGLTMSASVTEKKYNGTTGATVTAGALVGVVGKDDVSVAEPSVNGSFVDQYVGTGKSVTLSQDFTLTGDQAGNYTLTQPTVTGNISAANQNPSITATANVPRGGKTLDLSGLVTGVKENGNVHFTISAGSEYATLNGSTLTTKDTVGTVKITVKIDAVDLNGDDNPEYNAYTGTNAITVSVTLKENSTVTDAPNGIDGLVYDGNDLTLITAGTADGGELQYKLNDGAYSKDLPTAQNAGDYTVYYKVVGDDEHEDSVEQSLTVTIQKATVTITAKDKSAYVGSQVPVLPTTPVENTDYTVVGLLGGDTLTVLPTLKYVDAGGNEVTPDMTKVNDVTISISGAAASANYEIHFVDGKLVITYRPSSGGGAVTYPVNIPDKAENGSVSSDVKNASKGSTVTITVKPDAGFKLADLTVTDKDGNLLEITDKGDEKYTFVMPAGKVEVNATFAKETERSPFTDVSTDDYYYEAVKWAAEQGITSGIGNGLFSPDSPCTRAQIVTFLWRTAGSPEPKTLNSFNDVVSGSYYEKAVAWAVENGITVGTSATTFSPEATCTRAHAVTFLAREAKATASGSAGFRDVADNAYYAEAVKWATDNGITNGIGGGLFGPGNDCTRAQIVTFLWRLYAGK